MQELVSNIQYLIVNSLPGRDGGYRHLADTSVVSVSDVHVAFNKQVSKKQVRVIG